MGIKNKIKRIYKEHLINKNFGKFKSDITIKKDWSKINFNRIALINSAISNVLKKNKKCNYLEIGCDDNYVFNSIGLPIKYKTGVDPKNGGNYPFAGQDVNKAEQEWKWKPVQMTGYLDHTKEIKIEKE